MDNCKGVVYLILFEVHFICDALTVKDYFIKHNKDESKIGFKNDFSILLTIKKTLIVCFQGIKQNMKSFFCKNRLLHLL